MSAAKRGYGRAWEHTRRQVLQEEPVCKICDRALSQCVDHILPKARGGTDDRENLQGLCLPCHSRKTAEEDGGFGNPTK